MITGIKYLITTKTRNKKTKRYKGKTNDDGVLEIVDFTTNKTIPNNSDPSKKTILGVALEDLGRSISGSETTYQRYRLLQKIILKKSRDN